MSLLPIILDIKDTRNNKIKITIHLLYFMLHKQLSQDNNINTTSTNYYYSKQFKVFVYTIPILPLIFYGYTISTLSEHISIQYYTLSCFTHI